MVMLYFPNYLILNHVFISLGFFINNLQRARGLYFKPD